MGALNALLSTSGGTGSAGSRRRAPLLAAQPPHIHFIGLSTTPPERALCLLGVRGCLPGVRLRACRAQLHSWWAVPSPPGALGGAFMLASANPARCACVPMLALLKRAMRRLMAVRPWSCLGCGGEACLLAPHAASQCALFPACKDVHPLVQTA